MLDYRLLEALAAVISQGGFEKAAQTLYLTQSAVSRRIKQLEAVLGQPVLLRTTPPKPTAAGQRLLNHLQQVRQMEGSLGLAEPDSPLLVRLATNADSLATWLAHALVMPAPIQLRFDLIVEDQSVSLKRMQQGDVMACICDSPQPVNGGAVMPLGALRYRAVASPAFIQRYDLQPLTALALAQAPCLIFSADDLLQHRFLQDLAGITPTQLHICPFIRGLFKGGAGGPWFWPLTRTTNAALYRQWRTYRSSPWLSSWYATLLAPLAGRESAAKTAAFTGANLCAAIVGSASVEQTKSSRVCLTSVVV